MYEHGDALNKVIELNRNEIPYPPPQRVLVAAKEGLRLSNRYLKTRELDELRRRISVYSEVEENSIFIGSGAEVLITEMLHLFSRGGQSHHSGPDFLYNNVFSGES